MTEGILGLLILRGTAERVAVLRVSPQCRRPEAQITLTQRCAPSFDGPRDNDAFSVWGVGSKELRFMTRASLHATPRTRKPGAKGASRTAGHPVAYRLAVRRRLLIAAIFLLAGAVVNVAVAWGLGTWTLMVLSSRVNPQPFVQPLIYTGTYAVGWPTDALGYTWASDESPAYWSLRLIWPGFALNTLLYAAVLWLLIPGPFVLRRFIRVKRGLCPACAYDLRYGEHDACPECGRLPSAR